MRRAALLALGIAVPVASHAAVRFVIVDPTTKKPVAGVISIYRDNILAYTVETTGKQPSAWIPSSGKKRTVTITAGAALQVQQGPPEKEVSIIVRASLIAKPKPPSGSSGHEIDKSHIDKFTNPTQGGATTLLKGNPGIAADSTGQAHPRGEHAEIAYVVDGVPLPDTLAGRQGALVAPSIIDRYDILTGGFAPEFGGQTAAILDITTLPGARQFGGDLALQGGSYGTYNGNLTTQGPLTPWLSYVIDLSENTTQAAEEPHQPDNQDAHNAGSSRGLFASFKAKPSSKDVLDLTVTQNPDSLQIGNRTGLPASFANVGEGFGFLGLRNADGTTPSINQIVPGGLGSAPEVLKSQQAAGMDIDQDEMNEFAILDYHHKFNTSLAAQLSFTVLHAGSDLYNNNPAVDVTNLPVDNSIEYNPTVSRNVHHTQVSGNMEYKRGVHDVKWGGIFDSQTGNESYQITPASQLALDELAALDSALAPAGAPTGQKDVNGNPVYKATGPSPVLSVHRTGYYGAAYAQDTWRIGRFTANYGSRLDWYRQTESLGNSIVSTVDFSPRLNFSYKLNRSTDARASYDKLVNTPPLAQGAVVGAPIKPEVLSQYDLGLDHRLGHGQSLGLAYYYKDIRNQVDTGLLIPGSDVGLYSAVNFGRGAVHGIEVSYEISPPKGVGWDGYLNYSLSTAAPEGFDNTGAPAPTFNDHDQRNTVGAGLAYTWRSGASAAMTYEYGSGLASSVIDPGGPRIQRYQLDMHLTSGQAFLSHHLALTLDVQNITNQTSVINFESGFSGTRFMEGRRILFGIESKF